MVAVKGCHELLKFGRLLAKPALMCIPPPPHWLQQLLSPLGIPESAPQQAAHFRSMVNALQRRYAQNRQSARRPNGHPRERGARAHSDDDHIEALHVAVAENVLRTMDAKVVGATFGHDPRVPVFGAQPVQEIGVGFFAVCGAADGNQRHPGIAANGHDLGFWIAPAHDADGPNAGALAGDGRGKQVVREGATEREQRPGGLGRSSLEVQSELEGFVALRTLGVQQIEAADGEAEVGGGLVYSAEIHEFALNFDGNRPIWNLDLLITRTSI